MRGKRPESYCSSCSALEQRIFGRETRPCGQAGLIQSKDFRFFFAGDSGYAPLFKEIGQKLGPFDFQQFR